MGGIYLRFVFAVLGVVSVNGELEVIFKSMTNN